MAKILVTPRSITSAGGHPALGPLTKAGYELVFSSPGVFPTEEELLELLPGCAGYLAGVETISAPVLESASELRVISRNGTGIDNIDLAAARRLNIAICRAEGANAQGVAELTMSLVFALARSIPFSDARMKDEKWERRKGIELENRTLGLIGCGAIGKQVVPMAVGAGMNVIAFRRHPDPSFAPDRFEWVGLEELYEQSDIISLHLPARDKPLIDRAAIAKMKKGVYLINTSRGALVDDEAVLEALDSGHIAGFATDVYVQEPPSDHRLAKHDRVIATPHIGGYTTESVRRAVEIAVANLLENLK